MNDSTRSSSRQESGPLDPSVPIVLLASACWQTPTPVNVHHLARHLAGAGHRVLFVESTGLRPPSGRSAHDVRRVLSRVRDAGRGVQHPLADLPNLAVLSPLAIPGAGPALQRWSDRWVAATIRRAMRQCGMAGSQGPVIWSFLPTHFGIARQLPGRSLVYQCVDHYAANPGVDRARIDAAETAMLAQADLVLATSAELAERLRAQRDDVALSLNVADVDLFAPAVDDPLAEPGELAGLPRPRLIYAGNLAAYRLDVDVLAHLADRLPNAQLVLIGPIGLGDIAGPAGAMRELLDRPNVLHIGPRDQRDLAAYYRHSDVGLIPFLDNEHTRGSLPLKLWEYLAGGLAVVATDLPNLRDAGPQWAIRTAADPDAWVDAVNAAVADSTDRRQRLELARAHDWPARLDHLRRMVADACRG